MAAPAESKGGDVAAVADKLAATSIDGDDADNPVAGRVRSERLIASEGKVEVRGVYELLRGDKDRLMAHVNAINEAKAKKTKVEWEHLGLRKELCDGARTRGWSHPSGIQAGGIPFVLSAARPNVLAQARNGTGKTGAFSLSALSMVDLSKPVVQAMILVTTQDLANQVKREIVTLSGAESGISVQICAGHGATYFHTNPGAPVHIVVATPGKIMGVLKSRDKIIDLSDLRVLVVDEADALLTRHGQDLLTIRKCARTPPQVMMFSATFQCIDNAASPESKVKDVLMGQATVERKKPKKSGAKWITKYVPAKAPAPMFQVIVAEEYRHVTFVNLEVPSASVDDRCTILGSLYSTLEKAKAMVFCNTVKDVELVAQRLRESSGHSVGAFHSRLFKEKDAKTTQARQKAVREFEEGTTKMIVCTNVFAQGIDFGASVNVVVNFDLPQEQRGSMPDVTTFKQRSGRAGRVGVKGVCISLFPPAARPTREILFSKNAGGDTLKHFPKARIVQLAIPGEAIAEMKGFVDKDVELRKLQDKKKVIQDIIKNAEAGGKDASSLKPKLEEADKAATGMFDIVRKLKSELRPKLAPLKKIISEGLEDAGGF